MFFNLIQHDLTSPNSITVLKNQKCRNPFQISHFSHLRRNTGVLYFNVNVWCCDVGCYL